MIFQLTDKAILLSQSSFRNTKKTIVKNLLLDNFYPINFINHNINRRLQVLNENTQENNIRNRPNFDASKIIVVTYYRQFNTHFKITFNKINFKVVNNIPNKIH